MTKHTLTGQVVPFQRTADYIHKKALENRRAGRCLEAVELLRRAMERTCDNAMIQLDLAQTLTEMACYELSNRQLYQLIACQPELAQAYYQLAVNHYQLLNRDEALDSILNYLRLEPDGPFSDESHDMLEMLSLTGHDQLPGRQNPLLRQGIKAMQQEQYDKALHLFKRAQKAAPHNPRIHSVLALTLLAMNQPQKALYHGQKALNAEPDNVQARCAMCLILSALNKPRAALGILKAAQEDCQGPMDEASFCHTADQVGGKKMKHEYIFSRLKTTPYRVPLLHQAAIAQYETGDTAQAEKTWNLILRINPLDEAARSCLDHHQKGTLTTLPTPGEMPRAELIRLVRLMSKYITENDENIGDNAFSDEQWAEFQTVLHSMLALPQLQCQSALIYSICGWPKSKAVPFLKSLLVDDQVSAQTRGHAVAALSRLDEHGPFALLHQGRLAMVKCGIEDEQSKEGWQILMRMLMLENRPTGLARQAVFFALPYWRRMTPVMRSACCGENAYAWIAAFEILFLRSLGREDLVQSYVNALPISLRRVQRAINQLNQCLPPSGHEEASHGTT